MRAEGSTDKPLERYARGEAGSAGLEALKRSAARMGQEGDYGAEALQTNTQILEEDPDNFTALFRRGRCYQEQDDFPAAKKDYLHALQIQPEYKPVKDALTEIESGWNAAEERKKRRNEKRALAEKARVEAEKARAEDFRRVEAMTSFEEAYNLGEAVSKAHCPDYPLAIVAFKRAYRLNPLRKRRQGKTLVDLRPLRVLNRLAATYRLNEQLNDAEEMYKWVLNRDDENRYAKVGLAAVYQDKGRHSQALELYKSVLACHPRDAGALRGVGRTYYSIDRVEEAVRAFQTAAEVDGGNRESVAVAVSGLERIREDLQRKGETKQAQWVDAVLRRLRGS